MVDSRHRTTIEVNVDDRKLKTLDQTMKRAFDDSVMGRFEQSLAKAAQNLTTLQKAAERFEQSMRSAQQRQQQAPRRAPPGGGGGPGGAPGGGAPGGGGGGQPSWWSRTGSTAVGSYLGGLASRAPVGQGFVAQMAAGIPIFGGMIAGSLNAAQGYYQQFAASETTRARMAGQTGSRLRVPEATRSNFTRLGYDLPTSYGMMGNYSQQSGLTGANLSGDFLTQATNLQALGGVQNAASIVGAAGTAGGQTAMPAKLMMQAVAAGVASGVRESRLTQFIQVASSVLQQARSEGTNLSAEAVLGMQRGYSGLGEGFQGAAGTRAMQSTVTSMRGFKPTRSAASLVGLRAAGFGRGKSYMEALESFQERPQDVLPQVIREIRSMSGGNQHAGMQLMMDLMQELGGFRPTVRQARSLMMGDMSVLDAGGMGGEDFEATGLMERRRAATQGAFGTASVEAAYRNESIGLGGRVAGAVQTIRGMEMKMAAGIEPIVKGVAKMTEYLKGLYDTFQEEGFAGVMKKIFGDIGDLLKTAIEKITPTVDAATEAVERNVERSTSQYGEGVEAILNDPIGEARNLWNAVTGNEPVQAPASGSGDVGPQSSAADALERAEQSLREARGYLKNLDRLGEGQTAVG